MRDLWRDIARSARRIARTPASSTITVVLVVVGIGLLTAVYSAVYAAWLRPPAVPDVDTLTLVGNEGGSPRMSWLEYETLARTLRTFDDVAASVPWPGSILHGGHAQDVIVEAVSGTYFSVLGIRPIAGRLLGASDDRPGGLAAVVVSQRLGQRLFGEDPRAVGQDVTLNGVRLPVVGIVPGEYRGGAMVSALQPTDVWIAAGSVDPIPALARYVDRGNRTARRLFVWGRVAGPQTLAEANADVRRVAALLDTANGRISSDSKRRWSAVPARDARLRQFPVIRQQVRAALAALGIVLLLLCLSLAMLTAVRLDARRHELAIQAALGAPRWQVGRELIAEAALLGAAGAGGALAFARALTVAMTREIPYSRSTTMAFDPRLEPAVLWFGAASLTVAGAAALMPVWQVLRARRGRDDGAGRARPRETARWRLRRWSIAGHVAVSAALVMLAATVGRQTASIAMEDVGFDLDRLAVLVSAAPAARDRLRRSDVLLEAARQIQLHPLVEAAAVTSGLPGTDTPGAYIDVPEMQADDAFRVQLVAATSTIFDTLGVDVIRGRGLDAPDQSDLPGVVLGETTAARLFGPANPIGRQVALHTVSSDGRLATPQALVVLGVVGDDGPDAGSGRYSAYIPLSRFTEAHPLWIVARSPARPRELLPLLHQTVRRLDPQLPVAALETGLRLARPEFARGTLVSTFMAVLGLFTLGLALGGLYGLLTLLVMRRTTEIGLRQALGASPRQVTLLVVREGMIPVLAGVAAGVSGGVLARMAARPAFLRPIPEVDLWALGVVPIGVVVIALVACYLPARRAMRVDPAVALRDA